jgi:hypothetical protein
VQRGISKLLILAQEMNDLKVTNEVQLDPLQKWATRRKEPWEGSKLPQGEKGAQTGPSHR